MNKLFSHVAIPSTDFERAFAFYSTITNGRVARNPRVTFPMAYFLDQESQYVGHLFQLPGFRPSMDGPIVYMELAEDLNATLTLVQKAGGTTQMGKTLIAPGRGYWALFSDTEGNRLALHSHQ